MAERSNASVLKTELLERVTGVRIPIFPLGEVTASHSVEGIFTHNDLCLKCKSCFSFIVRW